MQREDLARTSKTIKSKADVLDAVNLIIKTAKEHKYSQAVNYLLSSVKLSNNWLDTYYQLAKLIDSLTTYEYDKLGKEQIKTPDRLLLKDRKGDCDDYSVLWSAILHRLNIRHFIKIVKYNKDGHWAHVYVVVPNHIKGIRQKDIVLDSVLIKKGGGGMKDFNNEVKHDLSKIFETWN